MSNNIDTNNIEAIECRFCVHIPTTPYCKLDLHMVKEQITLKDGTQVPNIRLIKNYKRDYWITKPYSKNHKEKKEWEDVDKLDNYKCTQSELINSISRSLGNNNTPSTLKQVCDSPYVYGADISSTSLIKQQYLKKYPNKKTTYKVATLDIEIDPDTDEIILITITYGNKVFTTILNKFIKNAENIDIELTNKINMYLSEYVDPSKYDFKWKIFESEKDLIIETIKMLHVWMPDFVAIWNITFDIGKIEERAKHFNINLPDLFSDPKVPKAFRRFRLVKGRTKKVTNDGKEMGLSPADQWHTVYSTSSFYFIDAMSSYKLIRIGSPEEPSYALDNILNKELGMRKLKFKEADHLSGLSWHYYMQEQFPVEYIVYNIFDALSMQELDKKTTDLSVMLPMMSGISDFSKFNSQPKRAADALHFYIQNFNKVMGTTGSSMKSEYDDITVSIKNWIIALKPYFISDNGLKIIEEYPDLYTNIRILTSDLDISSAYPSTEIASNISKETTVSELVKIKGKTPAIYKIQNLGLSSGHVNSLEYCQTMFNYPTLPQLLDKFKNN